jgi:hypothetical protein
MGEAMKEQVNCLSEAFPFARHSVFRTAADYFGTTSPLCRMASSAIGFGGTLLARYAYHGHQTSRRSSGLRLDRRISKWKPRDLHMCFFEVQYVVALIQLPELGYAKWAAASYEPFCFCVKKEKFRNQENSKSTCH